MVRVESNRSVVKHFNARFNKNFNKSGDGAPIFSLHVGTQPSEKGDCYAVELSDFSEATTRSPKSNVRENENL